MTSASHPQLPPSNFVPAYYDEGWEYRPDLCPCDDDYLDYITEHPDHSNISLVFHMGPGLHHKVGATFVEDPHEGTTNRVISYTVCPQELESYHELLPSIHERYTCLLRDVNDLSYVLPRFDAISLFHLGEYGYDTAVDYTRTLQHYANHLWPNGIIALYTKSTAASRVLPIADRLFPTHEDYKSLRIYHP